MTRAGVPLGIGMSFLVASPMVNEIAVVLLASIAGWWVALAYLGFGMAIAVTTGVVMGTLYGKKTESQTPAAGDGRQRAVAHMGRTACVRAFVRCAPSCVRCGPTWWSH